MASIDQGVARKLRSSVTWPAACTTHLVAGAQVRVHVGAAKAINGLLRDRRRKREPGAVRRAARPWNARRKIRPLRLVGVLELVDQRVPPARLHRLGEGPAARSLKRLIEEQEHVVEVVLPGFALAARKRLRGRRQKRAGEGSGNRRSRASQLESRVKSVRGERLGWRDVTPIVEQTAKVQRLGLDDERMGSPASPGPLRPCPTGRRGGRRWPSPCSRGHRSP